MEQAAKAVVDSFAVESSDEIEFVERCASRRPLRMFSAISRVKRQPVAFTPER